MGQEYLPGRLGVVGGRHDRALDRPRRHRRAAARTAGRRARSDRGVRVDRGVCRCSRWRCARAARAHAASPTIERVAVAAVAGGYAGEPRRNQQRPKHGNSSRGRRVAALVGTVSVRQTSGRVGAHTEPIPSPQVRPRRFRYEPVTRTRPVPPRSRRSPPRSSASINIASTLTPNIRWRGHLLLEFEPVEAIRLFHALSLPAGVALLLVAPYLAKRRRRAWQTAIVLMLALGLFDLLKGLDFEETIVTWGVALALIVGGSAFPRPPRSDHAALGDLARAAARLPSRWRIAAVRGLGSEGHPSSATVAPRDRSTCCAGSAGRSTSTTTSTPAWCRWRPHGRDRDAAGDRLRDLPAARRAACAAEPGGARRSPPTSCAPTAPTRSRSSSCAPTSTTSSARTGGRSSATAIENGVLLLSGDPVGPPTTPSPGCSASVRAVRRGPRPEARRARRQRATVPAVRGARAADDLPRRRGGRRAAAASRSRAARSARCASR